MLETDDEISKISEGKYRKMIDKKLHEHAIAHLKTLANTHSKSTKIAAEAFGKKDYFCDRRFTKEDVQLLFALRTKMIDCKSNFSNQYGNILTCRICHDIDSVEDESHILLCKTINTEEYDVCYSDVFGNTNEQYKVTQVFKKVLRKRKIYIEVANQSI